MKAMIAALLTLASFQFAHAASGDVKVDSILCYVEEVGGAPVLGSKFFELASQTARNERTCVVARIKGEQSGRVYGSDGSRLGKSAGALSHKEIKEIKEIYGYSRCKNYTCVESVL